MGDHSKPGASNAPKALQNHLDRDSSPFSAQLLHHRLADQEAARQAASFHSGQNNAGHQQLAEAQFAQEQMARMGLDDLDPRSASPAPISHQRGLLTPAPPARHSPQAFVDDYSDFLRRHNGGNLYTADPTMQQAALDHAAAGAGVRQMAPAPGSSALPGLFRPALPAPPGLFRPTLPAPPALSAPFGGQRFAPPIGRQPAFLPDQQRTQVLMNAPNGYSMSGQRTFSPALSDGTVHQDPLFKESAAAWQASFDEAMNEWVAIESEREAHDLMNQDRIAHGLPPVEFIEPEFLPEVTRREQQRAQKIQADIQRNLEKYGSHGDAFAATMELLDAQRQEKERLAMAKKAGARKAGNEATSATNNRPLNRTLDHPLDHPLEHPLDRPLDASDLARVAQQLVSAVADNDSEKFRKSNFVDLMRRIANQEVVIRDNSLVEAYTPTTAGNEENTQGGSSSKGKGKGKGKAVGKPASVEDPNADDERD
ncbi:hypothetical protein TruAng_000639 [Truncatella angustata]|nr:hypothetical protein TruAng_000639 [Truncatella angustata]